VEGGRVLVRELVREEKEKERGIGSDRGGMMERNKETEEERIMKAGTHIHTYTPTQRHTHTQCTYINKSLLLIP